MSSRRQYNVLFVFADQMHRYAMGCMGTDDIHTPNLDRLALQGTTFHNAYSNTPICTPFRINLFSGLYASQTGCFGNNHTMPSGRATLPDCLKAAGVRTSYIGKWHIGGNGNQPIRREHRAGFEDFIGYQCYNGFERDTVFFDEDNNPHYFDGHRTDVTTDIAIDRLKGMEKDKPFAMFVSYQAPHYPVQPSEKYEAMYRNTRIKRRPNMVDIDPFTPTFSPFSPRPVEKDPDFQRVGDNLDEYLRLYYALVTQVDAGVGRLLDTLEELGLSDDTVVVFTADHGDLQGAHGLKNKTQPYEESAGIPLIVRTPDGPQNVDSRALVSGIDYYPTIADWCGAYVPADLPGTSFAPLTEGFHQKLDSPIFSEHRGWRMVRFGDLKLVTDDETYEPTMLFDLHEDPYEMTNLVDDEFYAKERDQLQHMIVDWQRWAAMTSV